MRLNIEPKMDNKGEEDEGKTCKYREGETKGETSI
jgi:hypothetical protein